jgi:hypothetical protein
MFNFKVEKAPGYILKTLGCYFYFHVCILPSMFLTTYVAAHRGGGANIDKVLKKSNRWQCISFIFT